MVEDQAPGAKQPADGKPTPQARVMSAIDAALAPAVAHVKGLGTAGLSDLGVIVAAFRQALSHIVYGVHEEDVEPAEIHDAYGDQIKARRELNDLNARNAADAKQAEEPLADPEIEAPLVADPLNPVATEPVRVAPINPLS